MGDSYSFCNLSMYTINYGLRPGEEYLCDNKYNHDRGWGLWS